MPIYRSLSDESRTQITFKNDNALMFATHVLPKLKSRHGVVIRGFDEFVVNKEAEFSVTLDSSNGIITAIPSVRYGNIAFRLPTEKTDKTGKIIIRDNGQDIKEDINTEAVNIEIVSKKLFDNASYSKVCDMLGCILGLIDEKINRQNVEDYISQLIKLEHSEEHSKDLKADNVCMLYMNNKDGVAEIVLLPE